jgi:putative lipase involved disintegration of autophagic bodies
VGPVEVGVTMETWPDKQPSDVGWAYVSIGGEVYSEAVIVVVALESDTLRIRTVEVGRP